MKLEPLAMYPEIADYVASKMRQLKQEGIMILIESASSCAIEGNKVGAQVAETLSLILQRKPVGERFVMQLAWFLRDMEEAEEERKEA